MNRWNPNSRKNGIARLRRWTITSGKGTIAGGEESFSPTDISGLLRWHDTLDATMLYQDHTLATPAAANNDVIGGWKDRHTGAYHATQSTTANKPLLKTAGPNGKWMIESDGSNDILTTSAFQSFPSKRGTLVVAIKNLTGAFPNTCFYSDFTGGGDFAAISTDSGGTFYRWYDGSGWRNSDSLDPSDTWLVLGFVRVSDTQMNFYRNGELESVFTLADNQHTSKAHYIFGNASLSFFNGDMVANIEYDSALSGDDLQSVFDYINSNYALYTAVTKHVIFDGNSMTQGLYSNYPAGVMALLGSGWGSVNVGLSGQTTADMITRAALCVDVNYYSTYSKNIVVCWEGTNDLKLGTTATDAYNRLVTYCSARRAAGFRVVILTVLPRSDAGTPGGFEAARQTVNTNIRNNWATFADALADVAANSNIGDNGDSEDVTYYSDKVHMTTAGYDIVEGIVYPAIAGL